VNASQAADAFDPNSADLPTDTAVDVLATQRGGLVGVPIPFSDPAIGNGLAVMAGYLYALEGQDEQTPESLTALGGFWSDSDSKGVAAVQKLYLGQDRVRVTAAGGTSEFHTDFYGIGRRAGEQSRSVPLTQEGEFAFAQVLVRSWSELFIGSSIGYADLETTAPLDWPTENPIELNQSTRLRSYGLNLVGDWRDAAYYPTRGQLVALDASYRDIDGATDRSYWKYTASLNGYHSLGRSSDEASSRDVIAWRASGCYVDGKAPFYDLCLFGKNQDLRGYSVGRFRDRTQLSAQIEYRKLLSRRWAMTAFAGVGQVARSFNDIGSDDWLTSYGVGLRLRVSANPRIHLRVDYARGKQEEALHISVGEAF
jgi:hypothetical protein